MHSYLVFQLYAPLAAWGDIAVGEVRPSYTHPTRSALVGLLAAACGVKRTEEERQARMASAYRFAVRVDNPGQFMRDYHTVQPPRTESNVQWFTRRDELLAVRGQDGNAILSERDYYMDARYTVCVWVAAGETPPYRFEDLAKTLAAPVFSLYAGRKSCPLGAPLAAQVVEAATVREALQHARFPETPMPRAVDSPAFFHDACDHAGFDGHTLQHVRRRDVPASRVRWQFGERDEYQARSHALTQETKP